MFEFTRRELGGLTKNEINCRNYRSRTGRIDCRIFAFENNGRCNRARSRPDLRRRNFRAHQYLQGFHFDIGAIAFSPSRKAVEDLRPDFA